MDFIRFICCHGETEVNSTSVVCVLPTGRSCLQLLKFLRLIMSLVWFYPPSLECSMEFGREPSPWWRWVWTQNKRGESKAKDGGTECEKRRNCYIERRCPCGNCLRGLSEWTVKGIFVCRWTTRYYMIFASWVAKWSTLMSMVWHLEKQPIVFQ